MTTTPQRWLFPLFVALQGGLVLGLSVAAHRGAKPSVIAAGVALCFIPYAGAIWSSRSLGPTAAKAGIVAAAAFGAVLISAPPALSDDLYRYLWEGRLWLEGHNPFRDAPDDPALVALRDLDWALINNKSLTTIYPPLAQLLFIGSAWLGGTVWSVKLFALAGHLLCAAAIGRMCRDVRAASLAVGLNPLLLSESALNGHFDVLCGTALLIVAWSSARSRIGRAAAAATVAVGLKVVGLVALPLLWRWPKALLSAGVASALLLTPLVWWRPVADPGSGTVQFAMRWSGNESLFACFEWLSRRVLDPQSAELAARVVVIAIVIAMCAIVVRRRLPALQALRALVWAVLLLSPQVHPWYLAWLLPLEVASRGSAGFVWSAAVLFAYAPLDRWVTEGVWEMPLSLQLAEYTIVAAALFVDPRRPSLRRRG